MKWASSKTRAGQSRLQKSRADEIANMTQLYANSTLPRVSRWYKLSIMAAAIKSLRDNQVRQDESVVASEVTMQDAGSWGGGHRG
jgi:hypothetical protein